MWGKLDEIRIHATFIDYLHKDLETLCIIKERNLNAIIIHSSHQTLISSDNSSTNCGIWLGMYPKETGTWTCVSLGGWQCVWKFRRLTLIGVSVSLEARYEIRKICHFSFLSLYFLLAVQVVKTELLFLTEISSLYHHDSHHL